MITFLPPWSRVEDGLFSIASAPNHVLREWWLSKYKGRAATLGLTPEEWLLKRGDWGLRTISFFLEKPPDDCNPMLKSFMNSRLMVSVDYPRLLHDGLVERVVLVGVGRGIRVEVDPHRVREIVKPIHDATDFTRETELIANLFPHLLVVVAGMGHIPAEYIISVGGLSVGKKRNS